MPQLEMNDKTLLHQPGIVKSIKLAIIFARRQLGYQIRMRMMIIKCSMVGIVFVPIISIPLSGDGQY